MRTLHRLALAVQPLDAVTGRRAADVRVTREGRGPMAFEPGRDGFKLRHGRGVGERVTVRLDDPRRRWAPRRFDVAVWTSPDDPYIPAAGRLLRPWLLPGAGWAPPWGATVVRGRVVDAPWARIVATDDEGEELGWAHGDDRGEFLLLVRRAGRLQVAPPPTIPLTLTVHATTRPAADPPAEPIAAATGQPPPETPEHDVLRGVALPAGYRRIATVTVIARPGEPVTTAPIQE